MDIAKLKTAFAWLAGFEPAAHQVIQAIAKNPELHDKVPGLSNIAAEVDGVLTFLEQLKANPIPA
jgi:hypothetical protein